MVRLMLDAGVTICYTAATLYRKMAPFAKQIGLPNTSDRASTPQVQKALTEVKC